MSKFYRYRLPPLLRQMIGILEQITLPLAVFQLLRTLFIPTTFDIIMTAFLFFLYTCFKLKWI